MKRAVIVVALVIPSAILGYGYWFGATHGALLMSIVDVSEREHPAALTPVRVSFLDAGGRTLAEAEGTPPGGTIYLTSPPSYACHGVELRAPFSLDARQQWDECFARQSRWLTTWIRSVRAVDLRAGACLIGRLPVAVSEQSDTWWLWWVPLRHIGGKPYTSFSVSIEVDRRSRCEPRGAAK
jgi:hypothetical protein